jgi:hypothetical protein
MIFNEGNYPITLNLRDLRIKSIPPPESIVQENQKLTTKENKKIDKEDAKNDTEILK